MINHSLKFKFGWKALFRNPVRIIVSVITAIIAIGIAGMCIFTNTYNMVNWEKEMFFNDADDPYINITIDPMDNNPRISSVSNAYADRGYFTKERYISLIKDIENIGGGYATMLFSNYSTASEEDFSVYKLWDYLGSDQNTEVHENLYYEYNGETILAPYAYFSGTTDDMFIMNNRKDISRLFFSAITIYSGEDALNDFGYTLVGKLPEKKNEVAIPQWLYNSFLCYGYRNPDTGEVTKISSEEDIIGKGLRLTGDMVNHENSSVSAKIVGVIHNDLNDAYMNDFEYIDGNILDKTGTYSTPPYLGVVVSEEFFYNYRADRSAISTEAYVNHVTVSRKSEHAEEYFNYVTAWKQGKSLLDLYGNPDVYSVPVAKYVMSQRTYYLYGATPYIFQQTTIYFRIIPFLMPFAFVLLIYFSVSTIYGKRKEIGIFCSMGMSRKKLWLSFMASLFAVAVAVSLGGLAVELGFMGYMNAELLAFAKTTELVGFYPFTLNLPTLLFTFLSPLVTVTISSAITLFLLTRRSVCSLIAK